MSLDRPARLIEAERRAHPQVVTLARALSLAVRVEPALVRSMRLELAPQSDPGLESDLWFSPLVQVRAKHALTLLPDVVAALRRELAAASDKHAIERAWGVISRLHGIPPADDGFARAAISPALALEETITYLGTLGTRDALARIDFLLGRALSSLRRNEDRGLARWAVRTLPRLPENVRHSPAALALARAASAQMGGIAVKGVLVAEGMSGSWSPEEFRTLPSVEAGLRLVAGGLEISEPPAAGSYPLDVPFTTPLVFDVDMPVPSGWQTARETLPKNTTRVVRVPLGPMLKVRTLAGVEHRLRPDSPAGSRIIFLVDERRERFKAEDELNRAGDDLGWRAISGSWREQAPKQFANLDDGRVMAWWFDDLKDLEHAHGLGDEVSAVARHLRGGLAFVCVRDRLVVPSLSAADQAMNASHELARLRAEDEHAYYAEWTDALLREARRLFDVPAEVRSADAAGLRAFLLEIEAARVRAWLSGEAARREQPRADQPPEQPAAKTGLRGREDVLAELRTITSPQGRNASGCILLTGAAGVGKSAIARAFVEESHAQGAVAMHYEVEIDRPQTIEQIFTSVGADLMGRLDVRVRRPDSVRDAVATVLTEAAHRGRVGRDRPVILMIDRLDGPDRDGNPFSVLDVYLPSELPDGVFVITTARRVPAIARQQERLQIVDLDEPKWRPSADAAIEQFWRDSPVARDPERQVGEIERAQMVEFCDGNYRVAEMLDRWLDMMRGAGHVKVSIPPLRGLRAIVRVVFERAASLREALTQATFRAYRLMSVAREPIPLEDLLVQADGNWRGTVVPAVVTLSPLLVPLEPYAERHALLDRSSIVSAVAFTVAGLPYARDVAPERGHGELLDALDSLLEKTTEASPSVQWAAGYRSRYALYHAVEGNRLDKAASLCSSIDFLHDLIATSGYDEARRQIDRIDELKDPESRWNPILETMLRIVRENGRWLTREPDALQVIAHDHLLRERKSAEAIATEFHVDRSRLAVRLESTLGTPFESSSRFFEGHTAAVTCVAVSDDGAVAVSGAEDGAIRAWDLIERRLLWTLVRHESRITALAIAPPASFNTAPISAMSKVGMSGDARGVLHLWDVESGRELAEITGHEGAITACDVAVSAASVNLVTGGEDCRIHRWSGVAAGDGGLSVKALNVDVLATPAIGLAFVGDRLTSVSRDGRVRDSSSAPTPTGTPGEYWLGSGVASCSIDRGTGDVTARLSNGLLSTIGSNRVPTPLQEPAADIAQKPPGPCARTGDVVVAARGDVVSIIGASTLGRGHRDVIRAVAAPGNSSVRPSTADDGPRFVTGSNDYTVRSWEASRGRELAVLGEFGQPFDLMAVTPSRRLAVFPFESNALVVHDVRSNERVGDPRRFESRVTVCRFLDDNDTGALVVALDDGRVLISEDGLFTRFRPAVVHKAAVTAIEWFGASRTLVSAAADGSIGFYQQGRANVDDSRVRDRLARIAITAIDDRRFLTSAEPGVIATWDVERRAATTVGRYSDWRVRVIAGAQGGEIVTAWEDGALLAWNKENLESGVEKEPRRLAQFDRPAGACLATLEGSPPLLRTICGLDDGRIVVLEGESEPGAPQVVLEGHVKAINGLALLPESGHLVSWSLDGSLRVWDVWERRQIGATYSNAPFISARTVGDRIFALDALGQASQIRTPGPPSEAA